MLARLEALSIYKSAGPDGIPNALLKGTRNVISKYLAHLYRLSIYSSSIPPEWKHATVVPVFKCGDRRQRENYRPISLTSTACKVLESMVSDILSQHLAERCPISSTQYGFRERMSCTTQLLDYVDELTAALDRGMCVDVAYLDFSKAFDKVSHQLLISKILTRNVPVTIVQWIRNFLCGRTQSVRVNGVTSKPKPVTSGVPQGSILGPLLFLLFTDDIDSVIQVGAQVLKFADDMKVYYVYNPLSASHENPLQLSLNNVFAWSADNLLPLNLKKCSIVQFGKHNPRSSYYLNNTCLDTHSSERDLGVVIDDKLSFEQHISCMVRRARRLTGLMFHTFSSRSASVIMPIFNSCIRPVLEYASPVWNTSAVGHIKSIESVQRNVTKRLAGFASLSYADRLAALKQPSLSTRREYFDLVQMYKYVHGQSNIRCCTNLSFVRNHTRGHAFRLRKPRFRLNIRKSVFLLRTVNCWNALPTAVVNKKSVMSFKYHLRRYVQ